MDLRQNLDRVGKTAILAEALLLPGAIIGQLIEGASCGPYNLCLSPQARVGIFIAMIIGFVLVYRRLRQTTNYAIPALVIGIIILAGMYQLHYFLSPQLLLFTYAYFVLACISYPIAFCCGFAAVYALEQRRPSPTT